MRVKECMCSDVCCVGPETNIKEVAELMESKGIGSIPVCDESKKVLGFVTDRDIVTRAVAMGKDINNTKVSEIMTEDIIKATPDTTVQHIVEVMSYNQIRRIPVIENEQLVGIITVGDLAKSQDVGTHDVGKTMECICGCNDEEKKDK